MFVYRPVAFNDARFPDGRGFVLAWSIDLAYGPNQSDRALYLLTSGRRFFICGSVPERSELIGFLEIDHDMAHRTYNRLEKPLLPFPDSLIDQPSNAGGSVSWLSRARYVDWRD